jgi:hypothetical protein
MSWLGMLATMAVPEQSGIRVGTVVVLATVVLAVFACRIVGARRTRREHEFFEEQAWRLKRSGIKLVRPGLPVRPRAQDNDDPYPIWTLDDEIKEVTAQRVGRAGQRVGRRPLDLVPDRHGFMPLRKSQIDPSSDRAGSR